VIELLNIDCMEYMKGLEDNAFDLAIVDPPYGIGDTWSKQRKDRFYKQGKLHSYQNDQRPAAGYFNELIRISKNQIIWGGNYYTDYLSPTNAWVIWDKVRNADVTYMSEAEIAWTSFKKVMRIIQLLWDGARKCENTEKIHPHQKPVKLYQSLLKIYAAPGQKIIDTHLGSGSSAIAAHYFGCDFVGCEIDKDYYDAALSRFDAETRQIALV